MIYPMVIMHDGSKMFNTGFNVHIPISVAKKVLKGSPWIYEKSIIKQSKIGKSGDLAVIFDENKRFVGLGLYDEESPVKIRILHSGKPLKLDENWLKNKIQESVNIRLNHFNQKITNAFRLIHGENDKLPGIVLDKYGKTLVLRLDTAAWLFYIDILKSLICEILQNDRIVLRLSRNVINSKYNDFKDGSIINGQPIEKPVIFLENGLKFIVDPVKGQKTGFFLDQRDNRKKVESLSKGKSVINVFSYTGGFSLFAAKGGADYVASLDISKDALETVNKNFELNPKLSSTNHQIICGDAFKEIKNLRKNNKKFDIVILDPPSFASKKADIKNAKQAYFRLNSLGSDILKKGGMLISASCSSRIKSDVFFQTVISAIQSRNLNYEILEKTFHPIDHPVGFEEGEYLKCIYIKIL